MKIMLWKVKIREPFMGNQVPILITMMMTDESKVEAPIVTTMERIQHTAQPIGIDEAKEMFNG